MEGHLFEFALLFGVLGLAAAASLALRLPVVPLYIGAGAVIGGLLEVSEVVEFLGQLGVVFLLFSMGLEFSLGALAREPSRFAIPGIVDWIWNFPTGLIAGWVLGWDLTESVFLAGVLYMSSSSVVSRCIADFGRAARPETEIILGIMVFEDFVIALYLVLVSALLGVGGEAAGPGQIAVQLGSAFAFVLALLLLARRFQEPLERLIASRSDEGFTLALFAFVLLVASASAAVGLSGEIGAFLAGLVIGSTRLKQRAGPQLLPYQSVFSAIFFISFGMSLDLGSMGAVLVPGAVLVVLGLLTKTLSGYLAGRMTRHGPAQSITIGLSLVPKGEFSIVIAAMAASRTPEGSAILPITGLYVFALSVLGPIAMREADRIGALVERWLPSPAARGAGASREPEPDSPGTADEPADSAPPRS